MASSLPANSSIRASCNLRTREGPMNTWLAVLGVVALALIAVVVVGARRPRHAEDELAQPERRPARIDTPGSLDPAGLKVLLRSIQARRDTGTLQLTAGGRTASL